MVSLRALAREIYENARVHGWHDEPRSFGEIVALCHSELSEALEEYRNRMPMSYTDRTGKPQGIAIEMADALIRILDWFESAQRTWKPLSLRSTDTTSRGHIGTGGRRYDLRTRILDVDGAGLLRVPDFVRRVGAGDGVGDREG